MFLLAVCKESVYALSVNGFYTSEPQIQVKHLRPLPPSSSQGAMMYFSSILSFARTQGWGNHIYLPGCISSCFP